MLIEKNGIGFICKLIDSNLSKKLTLKAFVLLNDLAFYDYKLNLTYSNLENFNNNNAIHLS